MAGTGRKSAYLYFAQSTGNESNVFTSDEFEESDVWGSAGIEPRQSDSIPTKPILSSRSHRRKPTDRVDRATAPASLPVNIPDWSRIHRDDKYSGGGGNNNSSSSYNSSGRLIEVEDEEDVVTGVVIPPHELLWRSRAAPFSVHEGIGRTLKGRDLRRVRNAIFEKTGFQD